MAWVPLRSRPLAYHLARMRSGYLFIENAEGKEIVLSPRQRRVVGWANRLANLPRYLRRAALARRAAALAPAAPPLTDGYLNLSAVPGYEAAVAVCERQLEIYFHYLRRGDRAMRAHGIDPAAYKAEIAKTANDPLKHVPVRYDPEAVATLLDFGLQPALIASVSRHLGLLPILSGLRILYSPNDQAAKLTSAQLFHIDPEGARQAKIFMAVRPVGPKNSPFSFLPISVTRRLQFKGGDLFRSNRILDKFIFRFLDTRADLVEHTGRPGDALIVDTSQCLHFGSRPNEQPRVLLYFSFHDPFASSAPLRYQPERASLQWAKYKGKPHPLVDYLLSRKV